MNLRLFAANRRNACESLWPLLSAFADGETSDAVRARVAAHLAGCEDCASALASIQRTSSFLRAADEVEPPAYLRGSIFAATTALDASPAHRPVRAKIRLQWGFGAAAMAGILAALFYHANQQPGDLPSIATGPPPRVQAREVPRLESIAPLSPQNDQPAVRTARVNPPRPGLSAATVEKSERSEPPRIAEALMRESRQRPSVPSAPFIRPAGPQPRTTVAARGPKVTTKPSTVSPAPMPPTIAVTPMDMMSETPMTREEVANVPMPMESPMSAAEAAPMVVAEPVVRKIILTGESRALSAGQVASLADLKKSLRQQTFQWNRSEAFRGLNQRQISVELVKRSF